MKIHLHPLFLATAIAGWGVACSDSSSQKGANQKEPGTSNTGTAAGEDDEDDAELDGDTEGGDGDAPAGNADQVFSLWCEKAAETKAIMDKLGPFNKICDVKRYAETLQIATKVLSLDNPERFFGEITTIDHLRPLWPLRNSEFRPKPWRPATGKVPI